MSSQTLIVVRRRRGRLRLCRLGTRPGVVCAAGSRWPSRVPSGAAQPPGCANGIRRCRDSQRVAAKTGGGCSDCAANMLTPRSAKRARASLTAPAYLAADRVTSTTGFAPAHPAPSVRLMPLITLLRAELAFGTQPLLDRADFSIDPGERIGLIGRNGTGKSSLLGAIAGRCRSTTARCKRRDGLAHRARRAGARAARRPQRLREAAAARGRSRCDRGRARPAGGPKRGSSSILHRFGLDGTRCAARRSRAVNASAQRWRAPWRSSPTCCCSTSRPIISTSTASSCSKTLLLDGPAVDRRSRTIARSSTASPRASSSSTAACCAPIPGNFAAYERARPRTGGRSRCATASSTSSGRRKKSGSARASRRAARATRAACERWSSCARERAARRERLGNVKLGRRRRRALRASSSPSCRASASASASAPSCAISTCASCAATASA